MREFHFVYMCVVCVFLFPFVRHAIETTIKPLPVDADWMIRDTKTKAGLCAISYGIAIPAAMIGAAIGCDGIFYTPYNQISAVILIISFLLNVYVWFMVCIRKAQKRSITITRHCSTWLPIAAMSLILLHASITKTQI